MTDEEKARRRKKKIVVALVGVALGLACHVLPPDYRAPCQTIVQCGGLR